ncbi:Mog1/PsbP, alpha/beta/alpha sandwich [Ostreococcus tauri]|uniref:Mog1/PsbP, alpha/beta/alpha sandwich n=1 Tax=Ostreococcus tauri TaxID=70448 RepID=A0A090MDQ4_OSTTA|nr:Mog1/PsbP, alpha/beta/alpha sandwich [Ostreococcus tauri]CEG01066.1 Mog1/PsbP, alpha/beta/alpha sandwich [Ostreococcus tauri]|eukprot:XP_022840777.1 Mog1/PsbP, alpha/beta/alpha sandwich [Ostreococcus tauri]
MRDQSSLGSIARASSSAASSASSSSLPSSASRCARRRRRTRCPRTRRRGRRARRARCSGRRALFGGAVALALARRFRDASARAPVPNHQEVFVDDASEESVHVELVERERERGVGFYLDDWIEACEGEKIGRGRTEGGTCRGAMRARRDGVARVVDVFGCVIDLERVSARALIWHCRPRLREESDDATMTGTADDADDADARAASDVIESCASSFKVLDWGLFDA